ncbi:hypothetical protein [Emticicia agri]|uniref:Uncharacterized protein n=1 Tax=Emticicia agri TaxID=2492393 RepID=A0A4Q5M407_9BACT|nr:hypothetical protein [Emticicia agri]RYU97166.1 hypothetical protein EWM59_02420 [Emticicia agri]
MIRFIFDSFGSSHQDIFVKIDAGIATNEPYIADFYFVPDFLEFESAIQDEIEWKKACFRKFLEYLIDQISLNLDKTYLIFDLSDQYIGAIKIEKFTRNKTVCYKTSAVYSDKYYGWNMNYKIQQSEFMDSDWRQNSTIIWEITKDNLLKGIKWSIENLSIKTLL